MERERDGVRRRGKEERRKEGARERGTEERNQRLVLV